MLTEKINKLNKMAESNDIVDVLTYLADNYPNKILFTTSFGYEDQIITHLIFENDIPVEVATLDTGRLFEETYKVFNQTIDRYKKEIKVYFPMAAEVEKMLTKKGPYSFYHSVENRLECCYIRKVEPLNRALDGKELWVTGIRAEQSPNRQGMNFFELDESRQIIKYNPLIHWSFDEVKKFIKKNHIPYNVLHDRGFVSIGCQPCTRAIKPGEDFRAGRWWWENNSKKECGLHIPSK